MSTDFSKENEPLVHQLPSVPEWQQLSAEEREPVQLGDRPVVLKGLAQDWPLVQHGKVSFDELADYLLRFDVGHLFEAMISPSETRGRLFYDSAVKGFNFKRMNGLLPEAIKIFRELAAKPGPSFYIGSSLVSEYLPGLELQNTVPIVPPLVVPNIWMGTGVTVATHNDNSENIACVAAGRRRFTLFPPEQEENLYLGPEDLTPAGRSVSLVDLNQPDFARFPKFEHALAVAQTAVLDPGDAIYIPTEWWHNVESLADFNILVNYWWKGDPPPLHKISSPSA